MNKELKEKIAVNAANEWCRCFKCDGRVNATGYACEKDKRLTCHKWYDGYRTALLAISDYEQQLMAKAVDGYLSSTITGSEQVVSANVGYGELGKNGDKVKLIIITED